MRKKLAVSPARPRALPAGPSFYYRAEHNDHNFLEHYPRNGPFDAALLAGRYLAPYPPASKPSSWGFTGRELADALDSSGSPYVIDPDTPVLVAPVSKLPTPRLKNMPHAQTLMLPLSRMSFVANGDRIAFAQDAAAGQRGAAALAAPYFRFEAAGDKWHRLNLKLIEDVKPLTGGRPLVTFVEMPLASLVTGEVAKAAASYARLGVDRIFLRVAGFDTREVDRAAVEAYRRALDAFRNEDVDAVADCVGRFGLVAVASGAAGFSSGARHFQQVPEELTYDTDEMRSDPCCYEVPKRWFAMLPKEARRAADLLPGCPVPTCTALADDSSPRVQKEHLIHLFTEETRVYARGGATAARTSLEKYPYGNSSAWLSAL